MKYIAAYMLAKLGKENPTAEDIQKIIESVGIEFDQSKAEEIVNKLEGKNIQEVIDDGKSKLTVISNTRTIQNEQSPAIEKQEEGINEEEETLELGGGFDDLFNLK
ncbi:Serine/threonine-protein kinase TAO1 [Tritrichomonas musculus]|uniref:Serine/threonine-protein kinase TAO1 n=1 Tax=Tritrichomonas musculus TaxID=1915356 RepID=A0ABR2L2R1_9EUKA